MNILNKKTYIIDKKEYHLHIIENNKGQIKEILYNKEYEIIIPEVNKIIVNTSTGMFLVTDRITISENLIGCIYYYLDKNGIPVGYCFNNIIPDEIYPIPLDSHTTYIVGYDQFKDSVLDNIKSRLNKRNSFNEQLCLDLALHHRK